MKRILSILLVCLILGISIPVSYADAASVTEQTTYFADGSYCVETLTVCANEIATYSTTKSATKTAKYYDSTDKLCWKYDLTASFQVNSGVSATCTSCSDTVNLYVAEWTFVSKSATNSGNKATGTAKMKKNGKVATKTLTLTCSKNGVIS